jgi:hypothetical protein
MTDQPNYWVDQSITGDGTWVVCGDRECGVVEGFATEVEADKFCADLNSATGPDEG